MAEAKEPDERRSIHLAHHHPGRVRLRSKAFLGVGSAHAALDALRNESGVEAVEHRPITGSLLVRYVPGQIHADEILARAAEAHGLVVSDEPAPDPSDLPRLVLDASRELNELVCRVTGQRIDARGVVPLGLAGLAGYSLLVKKDRLPRWDNLAYWAFVIFTQLHREEIQAWQAATGSPGGEAVASAERGDASSGAV